MSLFVGRQTEPFFQPAHKNPLNHTTHSGECQIYGRADGAGPPLDKSLRKMLWYNRVSR